MSTVFQPPRITDPAEFGRVAVLLGGTSSEREVSLNSGGNVLEALRSRGVDAFAIDGVRALIEALNEKRVDRVFNVLHGSVGGGEDGVVQGLLDALGGRQPQLAASLSPRTVPLALTTQVAQSLLEEGVSLKGFPRIAAALSQYVATIQDAAQLAEAVRSRIGGLILSGIAPGGGTLKLVALAPELESLLVAAQRAAPNSDFPFEPALGKRIIDAMLSAAGPLVAAGTPVILVTQPGPRRALWRLLRPHLLIPVMGFAELQDHRAVEVVAVVGGELAAPNMESA